MPELPEVETVRTELEQAILKDCIEDTVLHRKDLRIPFPENLAGQLHGRTVLRLGRRGKYLLIEMDNGRILALHLGMSGRIRVVPGKAPYDPEKHDHMVLRMLSGTRIVLNDARRFGMVFLVDGPDIRSHPAFTDMGPEPLDDSFSGPVLMKRLENHGSAVKTALLDQRVIAGIGNIYACESLFEAKIAPDRPAKDIHAEEADTLALSIRNVLLRAVAAGGSTLKDYRRVSGQSGYFQHEFSVYGRAGQKCPGCDCTDGTIEKIIQGGRATFFCSQRQK